MRAFVRYMLLLVLAGVCTPPPPAAAQSHHARERRGGRLARHPGAGARPLPRNRDPRRSRAHAAQRRGEGQSRSATASIALDGTPVSGRELRDALGGDADVVIQLSYASPDALRAAFAPPQHQPRRARPPRPSRPPRQRRAAPPAAPEPACVSGARPRVEAEERRQGERVRQHRGGGGRAGDRGGRRHRWRRGCPRLRRGRRRGRARKRAAGPARGGPRGR